jgi:aspartate aminotransferase
VGWLTHPAWLNHAFNELIEYSVSSVPPFLQKAALVAVTEGEHLVQEIRERCRQGRDIVMSALLEHPKVAVSKPQAAFYAFFQVQGMNDSLDWAKQLFQETKVGVAPGRAFGPEGEGWIRLCFASSKENLNKAMQRLTVFLDRN